ncbi:NAD-dependent epimerase/dehydratase family protein [Pedobacter jejuensis]|uniref:NAD-dependent epimerase/dehydratase family protein n=1 Tax=Pedobacter jejuensis TaxID=1268550 RepID=A0A3N0C479_9SPHI|nr:NAD-dependent epimerase/dehydratase family protein [Pedobacter jejuensis]RNL56904.1 NAD-dependent epimerase/dehydratase family protein [Pedobacter jejuensis]
MKVIIIGSKGFIGSHLFKFFSTSNEVWGADISSSTEEKYFMLALQNTSFESIFEENDFDVCINASGNGSVPISLNKPVYDYELNVTNTIKLLDSIRVHNPTCKFINMSSAAVYGNPTTLPIVESNVLKPLSPYGWHKLYAEQLCKEYYYLYNIQTINLRLFSVYGEHLKKQLFWDTYQKAIRSNQIELFGSGEETRDFIYVEDLLNAIDCIVKRGLFNGEAINIATGKETSIKEATQTFCEFIDPNIKISFNNLIKPGDPLNWKADISMLKSFGFEPKVNIELGLENTVRWLKKNK